MGEYRKGEGGGDGAESCQASDSQAGSIRKSPLGAPLLQY
jgi:hypothetical protein